MTREGSSEPRPVVREMLSSIWWQMVLGFGGVSIGIIVLIGLVWLFGVPFTDFQGAYGQEQSEVLRNLNVLADLKKDRFELWLNERKETVRTLVQTMMVTVSLEAFSALVEKNPTRGKPSDQMWADLQEQQGYRMLILHLRQLVDTHDLYKRIQLVDARTGLVAASSDPADLGVNVSKTSAFIATMKSGYGEAFEVEKSPTGREPSLIISQAVTDPAKGEQNTIVGMVLFYIDLEGVLRPVFYRGVGSSGMEEVMLVNDQSKILMSLQHPLPDGTVARILEYRITALPATLAASGKEGSIIVEDYRGVEVIAAYRHIRVAPGQGWGLVIKRDISDVFAPLWRGLTYTLITGMCGIVIAGFLAVLVAGRISRPISDLGRTARLVESGDLNARAVVTGSSETKVLARTFNSMIDRVQNWHQDMKAQVEARTAELKQNERELQHKNAELERFTYTISHDLKSPLVTIKTFLGYLERDLSSSDAGRIEQDMRYMGTAADKMSRLLDELLEMSRIGRMVNPPVRIAFRELADEVLNLMAGPIAQRGVEVRVGDDTVMLYGDRPRLVEIWQNLVENAVKFMGDQAAPLIEIGAQTIDGDTVFFVRDNGKGIDPRHQAKVFGLFEKLDPSVEGTGLGLALVKRIVELYRGSIWLESQGSGACFRFTLPEAVREPQEGEPS